MAQPWEIRWERERLCRLNAIYESPVLSIGASPINRRPMPEIYDMDDYETLQTVAEICALQDILDRPD